MSTGGPKRKNVARRSHPREAPGIRSREARHRPDAPGSWPASSCDCTDCRQACQNSPGWFLPGQLAPLAKELGRSLEEIFRTSLALGTTLMPDGNHRQGVMPHKLRDFKKPGQIWTLAELADPGRCIFYERGKCAIYTVRPYECSRMQHSHAEQQTRELRHFIVGQWNRREIAPYLAWVAKRPGGRSGRRRG